MAIPSARLSGAAPRFKGAIAQQAQMISFIDDLKLLLIVTLAAAAHCPNKPPGGDGRVGWNDHDGQPAKRGGFRKLSRKA
ncbi:MAG TPA: hypothetical protein VGJ20_38695 [Xanthobacteraceae bacterium]